MSLYYLQCFPQIFGISLVWSEHRQSLSEWLWLQFPTALCVYSSTQRASCQVTFLCDLNHSTCQWSCQLRIHEILQINDHHINWHFAPSPLSFIYLMWSIEVSASILFADLAQFFQQVWEFVFVSFLTATSQALAWWRRLELSLTECQIQGLHHSN